MANIIWCQDIQTHVSGSLKSYCGTKACLGYLIHKCILYRSGFGSVSKVLTVKAQGLEIRSPHTPYKLGPVAPISNPRAGVSNTGRYLEFADQPIYSNQ